MIAIDVESLRGAIEYVKRKRKDLREAEKKQYHSQILAMYKELLYVSPQYSGDFVANWDIETANSPARGYQQVAGKGDVATMQQPHNAGDESSEFKSAYMRGLGRLRYIEPGMPVYFVNPSLIEIESPQVIGPDGKAQDLRDTSVITAWMSIHAHLQAKYGTAS